jgi:signal transduction histidine kinase
MDSESGENSKGASRGGLEDRIAELEHALRARDEFIAIAAHELRNPMMPILLSVQSLRLISERAGEQRPPQLDQRLAALEKRVRHFLRRASTLLDVSRIAAGGVQFELEPVDLSQLVREVLDEHADELNNARCELSVELQPDVTDLWDRLALEQVLTNLISNAIKYGAGAPIHVQLSADDAAATLVVRDQGVGISAEAQQRIFHKFERAVKRSEYGGFGIGLWITRQIVEGLGGEIDVQSQAHHGSTFRVVLPRRSTEDRR